MVLLHIIKYGEAQSLSVARGLSFGMVTPKPGFELKVGSSLVGNIVALSGGVSSSMAKKKRHMADD